MCAVIKKESTSVIVVPLTTNTRNGIKDINRVYFKLNYEGKEDACILSDVPIRVNITRLKNIFEKARVREYNCED